MFGHFIVENVAMFSDLASSSNLNHFAYINLPYNSMKLLDRSFPEEKCNTGGIEPSHFCD